MVDWLFFAPKFWCGGGGPTKVFCGSLNAYVAGIVVSGGGDI